MKNKMGFWQLFAIITGSQIGSGIFILPRTLAQYGALALYGWLIAGIGAISLALVFAKLVERCPKTGGPHAYVDRAFGNPLLTFLTGWGFWFVTAIALVTVSASAIGYLAESGLLSDMSPFWQIVYQWVILAILMTVNFYGVGNAGRLEVALMVIKVFTLVAVPLLAIAYFKWDHFVVGTAVKSQPILGVLGQAALLAFWAFVGLEAGTAPAGSVDNPKVTIPLALAAATGFVFFLNVFNFISVRGMFSNMQLMSSNAPYVTAVQMMLGGYWDKMLGIGAALICISNLNASLLVAGQISLGLAEDGYFPRQFEKTNQYNAPWLGILWATVLIAVLILLTIDEQIANQIEYMIEISVTLVNGVYIISSLSLLKMLWVDEKRKWLDFDVLITLLALGFCILVAFSATLNMSLLSLLMLAFGLPLYGYALANKKVVH